MNLPTYSSLYIKKKLIVHWYENPNIPCVHWSAHVYHWFAIRFYHFHPALTLRDSLSLTFQLKKKVLKNEWYWSFYQLSSLTQSPNNPNPFKQKLYTNLHSNSRIQISSHNHGRLHRKIQIPLLNATTPDKSYINPMMILYQQHKISISI